MYSGEKLTIPPMLPLIFPTDIEEGNQKEDLDTDAAWHFYSHSIRRNPSNLKLHTHRVFFAIQHQDASFLPGSLHDLFYVLKDAGEGLRIRLLKAAIPHLSKRDTLYFAMWIKVGIKKGMGYKWVPGSVLADGLFGPDQEIVHKETVAFNQVELTPLEEAKSCIKFGQLDMAQRVLTKALSEDPENPELQEELAILEKYTQSKTIQPSGEA